MFTITNEDVFWVPPALKAAADSRPSTSTDISLGDATVALLEKERRIPKEVRLKIIMFDLCIYNYKLKEFVSCNNGLKCGDSTVVYNTSAWLTKNTYNPTKNQSEAEAACERNFVA